MLRNAELLFSNPAEEWTSFSPASTGYKRKPLPNFLKKEPKPKITPRPRTTRPSIFRERPEPPKPVERPKPDPQEIKQKVFDTLKQKLKEDKYKLERTRNEIEEKIRSYEPGSYEAESLSKKRDQINHRLKAVDRKLTNIEKRSSISNVLIKISQELAMKKITRISLADYIRLKAGKYVWEKAEKDPSIKTLKYKSPFTGKKFHVSP